MNKAKILSILIICSHFIVQCATTTTIDLKQRVRTVGEVHLRSGPGMEHKIIETIPGGLSLEVLETQNDWHKVKLPSGKSGWIFKGLASTINTEKVVITKDTYVRNGPGTGYKTFAVLKKGKTFDINSEQGNWYLVVLPDGNTGWITKADAQKVERRNITTTQKTIVYQEADNSSREIFRISKGTELIQLDKVGSWYLIRVTEGVEGWIHEDAVKPVADQNLIVPEKANIRRGPGLEYEIIETFAVNTQLTELERRGDWIKVRTPSGETGWVYKAVITPSGKGVLESTSSDYVLAKQDCNIRQGYSTDFEILTRTKEGTILQVIGKKDDWLRIKFPPEGRIGWIRNDLVNNNPTILLTNLECNIRQGYSTSFPKIRRVAPATPLAKIEDRNNWYRVYLPDGTIGWIRNDLVSNSSDILVANQDCNLRQGPGLNWKKIGDLKAGTVIKKMKQQGDWYRIQQPNGDFAWLRNDLVIGIEDYKQAIDDINIRTGPGTNTNLLKEVPHNTALLKISSQGEWLQVRLLSGETGWVRGDLVSAVFLTGNDVNVSTTYTVKSYSTTTTKNSIITIKDTDIRTCPQIGCSILMTVKKGTELTKISDENNWYEIQLPDGNYGFVQKSDFIGSLLKTDKNLFYTKDNVRLRKGPATTFDIITTLESNTAVEKIEEKQNWYYVKLDNGRLGWIHSPLLVPSISSAATSEIWANEDIIVDYGTLRTLTAVNIYSEPNTKSRIIKAVQANSRLTKIGKKENWFQVQLDDKTFGWISKTGTEDKTLRTIITTMATALRRNPRTTSQAVEQLQVGTELNPIEGVEGWYSVKSSRGNVGWIKVAETVPLKYPKIYAFQNSNIRQAPSLQAPIIAVLEEGSELKPHTKENDWYLVSLSDGRLGWINKDIITKLQFPDVKIVRSTNAYRSPSINSEKIAMLSQGDRFQTAAKQGDWYRIYLRGGDVGWVYRTYLEEVMTGSILTKSPTTIRDGPGIDYSVIQNIQAGKDLKCLAEQGTWCKVLTENNEVGWINKDETKNLAYSPLLTVRQAYVRSGPGEKYAILVTLDSNSQITPIAQQGDWYEIKISETQKGWVHKDDFIKKVKSRYVFTLDVSKIRNGPGTNYQVLATVDPAIDLMVIGEDGDWYQVKMSDNGLVGWIRKDLVFE